MVHRDCRSKSGLQDLLGDDMEAEVEMLDFSQ